MILTLHVKNEYFVAIKNGTKTEEYRIRNAFWIPRIEGQEFESLVIYDGFPKLQDLTRKLVFPWRGYTIKKMTHPLWGDREVEVFAIKLAET